MRSLFLLATLLVSSDRVSLLDFDGDGVFDHLDNCPTMYNEPLANGEQPYICGGCEISLNYCALDYDCDGACNSTDNCDWTPNPLQTDIDMDGHGDMCDLCPEDSFGGWLDDTGRVVGGPCHL